MKNFFSRFDLFKGLKWTLLKLYMTISGRLFFYTAIPLCLISFVLCALYSAYLLEYHHEVFMQKGQADYYKIQSSLQYGIHTNNHSVIHKCLGRLHRPDFKKLVIVDNSGKVLYSSVHCGRSEHIDMPPEKLPHLHFFTRYARFIMPLDSINIPDFSDADDFISYGSGDILGWVILEYHLQKFWDDHQNIIAFAMIFLFQSIMLCYFISSHINHQLTQPMNELLRGLRALKKNNFVLNVEKRSFGEMNRLQCNATKMADSLRQGHSSLQRRIDDATSSLRHSMRKIEQQRSLLETAHRRSEQLSESKSQFLAHISHEYKTPLNSVIGFVDLMLQDKLSSLHQNYCQTIKNSARHLLTMIDDILDFNLIEAGKLAIIEKKVSLRDCIEDAINTLSPLASEKKLALNYLYYQDVPDEVITDKSRMRQVLLNLISNAIKFTEKGVVLVRVALSDKMTGDEKNSLLQISIQDTGPGIPEAIQKNLFKPFCHSHQQYSAGHSGSGLGLVITKKIVELLKGEVTFETSAEKGTTFQLTIPFYTPSCSQQAPKNWFYQGMKVALIDKDKFYTCIYHQMIHLGFKIDHYYSPDTFSEQKIPTDLIFYALYSQHDYHRAMSLCKKKGIALEKIYFYSYDQALLKQVLKQNCELCHVFALPIKTSNLKTLLTDRHREQEHYLHSDPSFDKDILIVDDNPINTQLLSSHLKKYDFNITCLHDSRQFLETVLQRRFDMIFLDIFMPHLDGIACIRSFRKHVHPTSQAPVIAVTANSLANDNDYLSKMTFENVLYKPLCQKKIHDLLKSYFHLPLVQPPSSIELNSQQQWMVVEQCHNQIRLCLESFYQSKFDILGSKIHALLGLVSYHQCFEEIYQLLSQLDQLLRSDTLNKKKILRLLKRVSIQAYSLHCNYEADKTEIAVR